ncbi:MAG: Oligopeptide transport ATP-binding protein OppF [Candidatus Lokiarchaeum sp. GC14_75]|nr:MAG: Oligopeptide transport ATP-binding protein OppF [Candidatus Lokiarchaeum sp. GC14_75]
MAIIVNLTTGELISEFINAIIVSILIFFCAIVFTRWYARRKVYDSSIRSAIQVSVIWLITDIALKFLILFILGPNMIFDAIRVVIEVFVIAVVVMKIYNKDLSDNLIIIKKALLFAAIVQVLLYIVTIDIEIFLESYLFMVSGRDDDLFASGMMFYFCLIVLIGINGFYVRWGDKMQFVKNRNIIILITTTPGIFYLSNLLYSQGKNFLPNYATNLLSSIVFGLIVSTIAKILSYRTIAFEEYRDLTVLEKGKLLLEVNGLKVYYPLIGGMLKRTFGSVKAVEGITFSIKTGETVGLVGESGCGKTTVANAILGLVPREAGEILFQGESIPNNYPKHFRQKIQIVFQDPDASLNPRMKIVNIIAEPLINLLGITKKDEIRKHVLKLLDEVSLKREHMDRYPHEFSGGQKQRIIIARALASNPELIILDEPTSALDVSVQAQILNLLKDLQKTYGYGFLFITHNLAVVNHIADRVAVMYLGKFVEIGETHQIFSRPTHPYTIALLESRTELDPSNKEIRFVIKGEVPSPIAPPPGCTFNPRCVSDAKTRECQFKLPHKIKIEEGHFIWCVNPPVSMQGKMDSEIEISDN